LLVLIIPRNSIIAPRNISNFKKLESQIKIFFLMKKGVFTPLIKLYISWHIGGFSTE